MNRLAFGRKIKLETTTTSKYLTYIEFRNHRAAPTRLLGSAHKLKIETGRYCKNRIDRNERFCDFCRQESS